MSGPIVGPGSQLAYIWQTFWQLPTRRVRLLTDGHQPGDTDSRATSGRKSAMGENTTPVYQAPVVLDAGAVVEVTLGTNNFDTADDTQYKNA
ncbi:lasso RiPP family leader peptide-containing protein [Streptomyces sp. AD55]